VPDPEQASGEETFEGYALAWLEHRDPGMEPEERTNLTLHVLPEIGHLPLSKVSAADGRSVTPFHRLSLVGWIRPRLAPSRARAEDGTERPQLDAATKVRRLSRSTAKTGANVIGSQVREVCEYLGLGHA
jgi:hypothetical protein